MSLKTRFLGLTFSLQKVLVYLRPLFRNPPRKRPNSVKLCGGYGYYAIQGHPRFGANRKLICNFLLVVKTNLPPILYRFRDMAFDRSKIAIFDYPLAFNSPGKRVPMGRSPYNFTWMSALASVPNGVETLPKISIAWVGCTNVTDRQTTVGRTMTYSERQLFEDWRLHLMTCLTTLVTWKWSGCLDVLAPPLRLENPPVWNTFRTIRGCHHEAASVHGRHHVGNWGHWALRNVVAMCSCLITEHSDMILGT